MLSEGIIVGNKVKILQAKHIFGLKHRKNHNGIVTHVDGAYIIVRPMWCTWELEAYPSELKILN